MYVRPRARFRPRNAGGAPFSPASLFTGGVQGAWYDPSDINNYMAGLGPELVTNGDFASGSTSWIFLDATWFVSGGQLSAVNGSNFNCYQDIAITIGNYYKVTYDLTYVSGSFSVRLGNQGAGTARTASGTYTEYIKAAGSGLAIYMMGSGTFNGSVDNISIKEVTTIANATLFQDSAGTTPVTAVEQPVGLMLDKSQGLVLGSELVTNGNFSVGTGWSTGGVWVISGGSASITSSTTSLSQSTLSAVVGTWYQVTFTISAFTAGGVRVEFGGVNGASRTAAGTYTQYILATSTSFLVISPIAISTLSIDNVSIKVIAGNHASQATAASRPVLRARYNLLTYSEQFDNPAWSKTQLNTTGTPAWINQAVAPDGTTTAEKLIPTAVSGQHYIAQQATLSATPYTFTVYAKSAEYGYCVLMFYGASATVSDKYAVFNLADGTATQTASGVTTSATSVGNGWFRLSITFTMLASGIVTQYVLASNASTYAGATFTGDGTSGIYVWGADLRTGSSAGTYQRIAAATDYATAGFLPYLYFVTDDSFGTNSINFTATDKMSVCAGVTKLSDAASGSVVAELSADINTNNGSFTLVQYSNATGWAFGSKGTIRQNAEPTGQFLGIRTDVLTGLSEINTPSVLLRVNGTQAVVNTTSQGTSNFGNYPLYIGRRGGSTLPFNGNLYQLIVCGKTLSASELASTETYVATKTGVTL